MRAALRQAGEGARAERAPGQVLVIAKYFEYCEVLIIAKYFSGWHVNSPKHWLEHLVALPDETVPSALEDGLHLVRRDVRVLGHQHLRPPIACDLHHLGKKVIRTLMQYLSNI